MGLRRKYGIMLLAAVMTVFVGAGLVSATDGESRDYKMENTTVAQGTTHDGALYAVGQSLNVAGTVKGDVYCGVQNATITGTVEGDVICGAQSIRIAGTVKGDVRVGAQSATFDGAVEGTVTVFAQNLDITSNTTIAQDLNGAAGTAGMNGKVGRDMLFASEFMTVSGAVERNVGGEYDRLAVTEGARVGGFLRYGSENDATVADGTVVGEVVRSEPQREYRQFDGEEFVAGAAFYTFFSMLLIALAIVLIAPRLVHTVTDSGVNRLLPSLLVGFFVVFGGPFILMLLAMTVIGIPLAGLVFLAWLLIVLLSGPFFGYYLGRIIMQQRTTNPLLIMLVGASVLILIFFVPIANIFAFFATVTIGSGMAVLALTDRYKRPVYSVQKEVIAPAKTKKS